MILEEKKSINIKTENEWKNAALFSRKNTFVIPINIENFFSNQRAFTDVGLLAERQERSEVIKTFE